MLVRLERPFLTAPAGLILSSVPKSQATVICDGCGKRRICTWFVPAPEYSQVITGMDLCRTCSKSLEINPEEEP